MATALLMASRSSCERLNVGCVIVSGGMQKNRIVAAGYNGFLPGASHISRIRDGHEQATITPNRMRSVMPHDGASRLKVRLYISPIFLVSIVPKFWPQQESKALSIIVIIETMI